MIWQVDDDPRLIDQVPPWIRAAGRISLRLAIIALVLFVMVLVYYWMQASRFNLSEINALPERTLLLDRDGQELGAIHGVRRRVITYEDLPTHLTKALQVREDRQFRNHGGVHLRGVFRAALRNLKDGKMTQGASTLTMQLARNTYELRANSLNRKFLEAALAFRIEANFSKEEIITAYLNRIYFGAGAYGIEQASRSYFGKPTAELSLPEAALLVGIIRAPHDFSPRNDPAAALRERDSVLTNLREDGYLTPEELARYQAEPLTLSVLSESQTDAIRCVRRHLNELLDRNDFATGGLTVTSTISTQLQLATRQGLDGILRQYPGLQAGLVAIDPATGAIRVTITARDPDSSQFNRAFDTRRQLGPVFQPFLYAFSAERGHLPIPGQPIQTARQLPAGEVVRLSERLGLQGPFTTGDELARGNLQATPLEMATALMPLANEGTSPATFLVSKLTDSQNRLLFEQKITPRAVLDSFAAKTPFEMTREQTWASLNNPGTDLWGLHTSRDLTIALWIGYDEPAAIPESEALANQVKAFLASVARIESLRP